MNAFFRRLSYLWNRRRLDQELANDMEFHREMASRDGGRPLGDTWRLREEAREAWGWTWIDRLAQDLRYAIRMLQKSPGFTATSVLTLAIGIGVNVAAFGFFNLMVLRPLPVRDPATLLRFQRESPQGYASVLPYPEMAFLRDNSKTLSAVLAWSPTRVTLESEPRPVRAHFTTANLFAELGATPALGRTLDPARDDAPDAEPVAVLSHPFWQSQFGSDPLIVGRTIRLNGKPATVVGVAAREFSGLSLDNPDMWLPIKQHLYFVDGSKLLTDFSIDGSGVTVWGRLQPGLTPKVAEDELRVLAAELHKQRPNDIWENESLPSQPGAYATSAKGGSHHGSGTKDPDMSIPVAAMMGALVLLILAVSCGNLGSLLLARGVAREREISIRVAIGAGTGRLVRQLLTESLLLGLLGSIAGAALGYVVLRSLMAATSTPAWLDPSPDWRVMLFAVAMGFLAAILFGLTPALQLARQRHRATFMRQVLIGAQVAASCVLLIVAGLLVRALNRATSTEPGFEYRQIVFIDPSLGSHDYSPAKSRAYFDSLKRRLHDLPGVESVALATTAPLGNKTTSVGMEENGRRISIHVNSVDEQYFETMKLPLLRGRNLMRGDTQAIVISQALAAFVWPGQDPIGKPLDMGKAKYTVVGISGNAAVAEIQDRESVEAYFLADASDLPSMTVLVRTSSGPESLLPAISTIARAIDGKVLPEVQLLKAAYQRRMQNAEYSVLSVSVLALTALLLASLGIVGLVAYAVSQRTKEIGIRMALGARPFHVLSIVLMQFSRPVAAGLLLGVAGAAALSQILRQVLYGISNLDPIAYLAALGVFAVTVIAAALLPARRALRLDPMLALRQE